MTDEERLRCARVGVVAAIDELEDRLTELHTATRKTKAMQAEIERLTSPRTLLQHALGRIDEVLDAMEAERKARDGGCRVDKAFVHNLCLKGADISKLRTTLGFDAGHFAALLGIHSSTLYRWEKRAANEVRAEPLQCRLIAALGTVVSRYEHPPDNARTFGANLLGAVITGGTLRGIHCLLARLFDEPRKMVSP
jgi:DNA-binding transcriptional regulator YiaG